VNAPTFTKQAEEVQTNVCQKADGNCFLGQERSSDGGIHATRDSMSEVHCKTLNRLVGPFRMKGVEC
jgi:hypothetical protein